MRNPAAVYWAIKRGKYDEGVLRAAQTYFTDMEEVPEWFIKYGENVISWDENGVPTYAEEETTVYDQGTSEIATGILF